MLLEEGGVFSGKQCGELKVLYRIALGGYHNNKYKCLCSCGKLIDITEHTIRHGITSCGCLRHGKYKGLSLRYILGYKSPISITEIEGVYFNHNNTYTSTIRLYGKKFYLGVRKTLQEAKELREWGEELFYKPIVEEYYNLRANLKVEDIPIDKRKGEYEEEIIGNYITYLGTMSEEKIEESIQNVKSQIMHITGKRKKMPANKNIDMDSKDLNKKKHKQNNTNTLNSKRLKKSRKVKAKNGKVRLFKSKYNIPNSCGCGSYVYKKEVDGLFIIDVCNVCGKDIGVHPQNGDFNE